MGHFCRDRLENCKRKVIQLTVKNNQVHLENGITLNIPPEFLMVIKSFYLGQPPGVLSFCSSQRPHPRLQEQLHWFSCRRPPNSLTLYPFSLFPSTWREAPFFIF